MERPSPAVLSAPSRGCTMRIVDETIWAEIKVAVEIQALRNAAGLSHGWRWGNAKQPPTRGRDARRCSAGDGRRTSPGSRVNCGSA